VLGVGGLLACGWRVTKTALPYILLTGIVFYFPLGLLDALAEGNEDFTPFAILLYLFVNTYIVLWVIIVTRRVIDGEEAVYGYALRTALRLVPRAVIASVMAGVIVILMSFLLIVPGIIWAVYYTFILNAIALGYEGGKRALDYSKSLVRGRWLEVFGVSLLVGLTAGILVLAISVPASMLAYYIIPGSLVPTAISYALIYTLSLFYFITMTVYFLNLEQLAVEDERPVEVPAYLRQGLDRLSNTPEDA